MKQTDPIVDYRGFRLSRLNTEPFRHLKLLLYWPLFGVLFYLAERVLIPAHYYPVYIPLDSRIPFCELFLIPYLFWFVYLVGMHLYTLLFDVRAFRRMMKFIIFTYSVALVLFFVFPTCQNLRPAVFPRDNVLTRFMAGFYRFDTSTNVLPSLHVVGSFAVHFAALDSKRFRTPAWRSFFTVSTALISISTVFLKQHSVLDVAAGLLVCAAGYALVYGEGKLAESTPWGGRKKSTAK